ncbi:MAG: right-handed parallel beta-helix repeat-containing protein, partial [Pseudomonadales bacterium]
MRFWLLFSLSAVLAGCGGGGGSTPAPDPVGGGAPPADDTDNGAVASPPPMDLSSVEPAGYGFTTLRYVDGNLGGTCSGRYSAPARACGSGADTAYATLAAAAAAAQPGVQFVVRGGTYRESLRLRISGRADAYVGFTAEAGETVVLSGVDSLESGEEYGAIWMDHVRYNLVRGFVVRGSVGYLRAVDAHYNVIREGVFEGSTLYPDASKRGGLYFAWSSHNKVLDSTINRGTDSLALIHSDYNVVHGNRFDRAGHDVWNIKCGSFNVIRGNIITNPEQKMGSVFDCEAATTGWHGNGEFAEEVAIVDSTRRNLIDGNVFHESSSYYSSSGGNGIQYAGQQGIIRRNVFYRNNIGLGMTQYPDEAMYNWGNRVYNNVFHDNRCAGIFAQGGAGGGRVEDNRYINNVLWDNHGWLPDGNCDGQGPGQVLFRLSLAEHRFVTNLVASPDGDAVIREEFGDGGTVGDFTDGGNFAGTIQVTPGFAAEADRDYRPGAGSALIDAGQWLTSTRSEGSGRIVAVQDAGWFYDGYGIVGEQGDLVQFEGQSDSYRIVSVDDSARTITLATDASWRAGQGLAL